MDLSAQPKKRGEKERSRKGDHLVSALTIELTHQMRAPYVVSALFFTATFDDRNIKGIPSGVVSNLLLLMVGGEAWITTTSNERVKQCA